MPRLVELLDWRLCTHLATDVDRGRGPSLASAFGTARCASFVLRSAPRCLTLFVSGPGSPTDSPDPARGPGSIRLSQPAGARGSRGMWGCARMTTRNIASEGRGRDERHRGGRGWPGAPRRSRASPRARAATRQPSAPQVRSEAGCAEKVARRLGEDRPGPRSNPGLCDRVQSERGHAGKSPMLRESTHYKWPPRRLRYYRCFSRQGQVKLRCYQYEQEHVVTRTKQQSVPRFSPPIQRKGVLS